MAGSLGKAYVQIVPSAEGIAGKLQAAIAPEAKIAGAGAGKSLSANLGNGLKSIGGAMTSYITKPAMAAVTALGGATLFSGWKRMTEIDNAKVKLEAIGNTTKDVTKIQQNAMEAVKGTAFGMNAAMTTSASAVAAGIKPGKELTKYLTAISDAAAVAGTDMSSMGAIFNKVATSGKAQNDVLSQMADAGIPIYQYLADQMGVTAGEVFEMASAGEVSLANFQAAVSTHIGGAAKEIGSKTITGALSNVRASISRIGANFLGSADDADSFAGKVLPILNGLMDNLEPVEEKAKELGSAFADGFQKFSDVISSIPLPVLGGLVGALVTIGPALKIIGTIMTAIGPMTTAMSAVLGGPMTAAIMGAVGPIAAFGAALVLIYTRSESFRQAVGNLMSVIGAGLQPVISYVVEFIKIFVTEVMTCASAIGDALTPVIEFISPIIMILATAVGVKLAAAFKVLGAVVKSISAAIQAVAAIVRGVFTAINQIVSKVVGPIKRVCSEIQRAFRFQGINGVVRAVFGGAAKLMQNPIKAAGDAIKGIIDKIKGFFNFRVPAPHVPLPHFSVRPAGWKVGDLLKGKIPSLGVSWYAKAEDEPYMFSNATLFGAGERNDEILYGRQNLMNDIKSAVGGGGNITINLNYDASADAGKMVRDIARGIKRYKMAGAF